MRPDRVNGCLVVIDAVRRDRERLAAELDAALDLQVVTVSEVRDAALLESDVRALVLALGSEHASAAVREARRCYGEATLIVIGYLTAQAGFEVARAGADALLPKPVTGRQIAALIGCEQAAREHAPGCVSLARAEWEYLHAVLSSCDGNRSEAARRLKIHRSVLQRKLARHPPP